MEENNSMYFSDMKLSKYENWFVYDFKINEAMSWKEAVSRIQYVVDSDIDGLGSVTMSEKPSTPEIECMHLVRENDGRIEGCKIFEIEAGLISIGGFSRILDAPVKIVIYAKINAIKIATLDEMRYEEITEYADKILGKGFEA